MASDDNLTRALKILGIITLSVFLAGVVMVFLHRIMAVVILVVAAIFFVYLIYPIVQRFSRRMPRWLAIICVYAIFALGIALVGAFIGPRIVFESRAFANDFPGLMQQAQNDILNANIAIITAVPLVARETAVQLLQNAGSALQHSAGMIVTQALTVLLSVASVVSAFVIIPVLAFYILMDIERIHAGALRLVPAGQRETFSLALQDIDSVLGGYVRGQVIVGAVVAVLVTVLLLLLRIKYAFLIGLFAGVVDIIPYLGAIAGAIPAVLIALFSHGVGWALLVTAGFTAIYQIEGHVVAPNVVGQRVGLTPLMVIVSILVGAELGGIIGMFFAVPVAAVIRALASRFLPAKEVQRAASR